MSKELWQRYILADTISLLIEKMGDVAEQDISWSEQKHYSFF
jgi:hypothetical protein